MYVFGMQEELYAVGERERVGGRGWGPGARGWGRKTDLCMRQQALYVLRHTGGVVCRGAANALDHVYTIARLLADRTVVLRAPEVGSLLCHLS